MQPAICHDDLDELRQRKIAVPAAFRRGGWLTLPLGPRAAAAPGPSPTQLLLWLPVRAAAADSDAATPTWAEVDAAIGAPGPATSRTVPAATSALWDGEPAPEAIAVRDAWTVYGVDYPSGAQAFGNIFWKHGWVLATRAGLLVSLVNG